MNVHFRMENYTLHMKRNKIEVPYRRWKVLCIKKSPKRMRGLAVAG